MDDGTAQPADDVLGIPGFTAAQRIGQGGYGVVYRARQPGLERDVAVKILTGSLDPDAERRFERERRAMGALSGHPAIVNVHDSGVNAAGRPFLVMEYMARGSLGDRLEAAGPMPPAEVASVGARIAGALDAAHAAGLLHRDVKPENILVSGYGEVKLSDFGIATLTGGSVSATNTVTASIAHAAPEVLEGKKASVSSDVYSLGSTLFALLSGRSPFSRDTDESIVPMMTRALTEPPPDLRPLGVPDALASTVERAMAKDPAQRHETAAALGAALLGALGPAGEQPSAEVTDRPARAATVVVPPPGAPPPGLGPPPSTPARRSRRGAVVLAIAAALMLLVGGVALAVTLVGRDGDATADVRGAAGARDDTERTTTTTADATAPGLVIESPASGAVLTEPAVTVAGRADPGSRLAIEEYGSYENPALRLPGVDVEVAADGAWRKEGIPLVAGANYLRIAAFDPAGNRHASELIVTYTPPAPAGGGGGGGGAGGRDSSDAPPSAPPPSAGGADQPQPASDPPPVDPDAHFNQLATACYNADFGACDSLYRETPVGSALETYGSTCGGRDGLTAGRCAALYSLAVGCYNGNWSSCDTLYAESPVGGYWEWYGDTCGGRIQPGTGKLCTYWASYGYL